DRHGRLSRRTTPNALRNPARRPGSCAFGKVCRRVRQDKADFGWLVGLILLPSRADSSGEPLHRQGRASGSKIAA
ncbi:hypothetical protein LXM94_17640, partial [Rhizobium sp. TRM95111]|uniref:hypothetical protein n=1 Tax=Rhizobium alarense TaxID=2846851 RepID=UPI001F2650B9